MSHETDTTSPQPPAIALVAGTYVDVAPTTEDLVAATIAAEVPQTARWIERLREDGILAVVAMRSRGFAEGRYAVYGPGATDLVVAAARMRQAKVKTEDMVVRLALGGHGIPAWRLRKALQYGSGPYRRMLAIAEKLDHTREADCIVNGFERSKKKREQYGIDVQPRFIDGFVRDMFDDMLAITAGTLLRAATPVPALLRRMFRFEPHEEEALTRAGMGALVDEISHASQCIRDGIRALDDVSEGDMPRLLLALRALIEIRENAISLGRGGDVLASVVGRALSFIPLESSFGLFIAFVFLRMFDEVARKREVPPTDSSNAVAIDTDASAETRANRT